MERDAFWPQIMDTKYGSLVGGWCTNDVIELYEVSLWKHIRMVWDASSSFASVEVGDGFRTRFWHDMWWGDFPLKDSF